ncbi:ROK family protein, partial [Nocardioides sp.]|uniref:ROK family protein n=1 Tax=Nocardioides sp. TaxID=35761 RepID=UPI0027344AFD
AGAVLAAAIGRSRTQLAVCDLDGTVLASVDRDQEIGLGPDVLLPLVVEWFRELLAEADLVAGDVWAIGLSLPGTVDTARGVSVDSPVMTGWDGVDLVPYFAGLTGSPLFVDNDANVLALSEVDGHLLRFRDALVVKASTGFGLGVVADGRVIRGHLGAAGEVGHVKVEAARDLPCRCGDTGCLEAVGAGWAVVQRYNQAVEGRSLPHVRDLVGLALRGDPEARGLLRASGRRLGEALAGAVNVLNPEAIIIGGDMGAAFDVFAAGLRETLYPRASALATSALQVLPSTHGDRAGVVGCAALALDRMLSPSAVDARLLAAGR